MEKINQISGASKGMIATQSEFSLFTKNTYYKLCLIGGITTMGKAFFSSLG